MLLSSYYTSATREFEDLKRYARRLQRLLQEDEQSRQQWVQHLSEKQAELEELFSDPFPQVFYTSLLVADASLLEQHIRNIAKRAQEILGQPGGLEDSRRSLTKRFQKYCTETLKLESDIKSEDWEFIEGLYQLRNSIAHSGGRAEKAVLRTFAAKHELYIEEDGVWLHYDDVVKFIDRTWQFLDAVYMAVLRNFPSDRFRIPGHE